MFDTASRGIREILELDPACLNAAGLNDAVVEVQQLQAQLAAAGAKLIGAWAERGCWETDGAKSPAAWLAWKTHQPKPVMGRTVRQADALQNMPVAAAALAAGEISSAHVDQLRKIRTPATAEQYARDEKLLVEQAKTMHFTQFLKTLAYWQQLADPDGTETTAAKRDAKQHFDLSSSLNAMWFGSLTLNPIAGTILADTLHDIEQQLYRQEKQEGDIVLTNSQRRAAALVEMAIRARRVNPNQTSRAPLFTVLVDYPTIHGRVCELANGMVLTPGQLLPWMTQAYIERAVFNPATRHIDQIGERKRLYTGATRRAVQLRDQTCYHPTCDEPIARCEIDHTNPWSNNGPTTPDNGVGSPGTELEFAL